MVPTACRPEATALTKPSLVTSCPQDSRGGVGRPLRSSIALSDPGRKVVIVVGRGRFGFGGGLSSMIQKLLLSSSSSPSPSVGIPSFRGTSVVSGRSQADGLSEGGRSEEGM